MVLELPGLEIAPPRDLALWMKRCATSSGSPGWHSRAPTPCGQWGKGCGPSASRCRSDPAGRAWPWSEALPRPRCARCFLARKPLSAPRPPRGRAGSPSLLAAGGVRGPDLLPVSSRGRPELERGLLEAGPSWNASWPRAARAGRRRRGLEECLRRNPDLFVFASPSAIEGLGGALRLKGRRAVVIGPTTEAAAREAGLEVAAVAPDPSPPGSSRLSSWPSGDAPPAVDKRPVSHYYVAFFA